MGFVWEPENKAKIYQFVHFKKGTRSVRMNFLDLVQMNEFVPFEIWDAKKKLKLIFKMRNFIDMFTIE